jgi:phosphatidylglycerol---prolipoprotein diacylglyceryl transferase
MDHYIWNIRPSVFEGHDLPRWYSLLFSLGLYTGYQITGKLLNPKVITEDEYGDVFVAGIIGMAVGMRLGHCLFYEPDIYLADPIRILKIWEGGYASHAGFVGLFLAVFLKLRRLTKVPLLWFFDKVATGCVAVAAFIRVGNFFNSEMIGHESSMPWAIVFSQIDLVPRHPAQLYEAIGYAVISVLSLRLNKLSSFADRHGKILGVILVLISFWRIFCEFFKIEQVEFEKGMFLNMGQILSLPFLLIGIWLIMNAARKGPQVLVVD